MHRFLTPCGLAAALVVSAFSLQAQAGCISVDRSNGTRLTNSCGHAVYVCWKDADLCKTGCSEMVGAHNDTLVTNWTGQTNYNSISKQELNEGGHCTVGSPDDVTYDSRHRPHPTGHALAQARAKGRTHVAQRHARARVAMARHGWRVRHASRGGGGGEPDLRGQCPEVGPMSPACLAYFHRHPNE